MNQLALQAGYSRSTTMHKQKEVFNGKGFLELIADKLPDDHLIDRHEHWIDTNKYPTVSLNAISLAYKLKGYLKDEVNLNNNISFNIKSSLSPEDNIIKLPPDIDIENKEKEKRV